MKLNNVFRVLRARATLLAVDEAGMSTVVTGDSIVSALTNIIARALNTKA